MTVREKMETWLVDRGLFPNEAKAVMDAVVAQPEQKAMEKRWNDAAEGYPPPLFAVLAMSASDQAVKWIDANKPLHWARPMFAGEAA